MEVVVMRSFISATCCLIVGLEILVGVPIAVCVGFLCVSWETSGSYVAETPVSGPVYSRPTYLPPPLPAAPLGAYTDPGKPSVTYDPYSPSPKASVCPAPTASMACVAPLPSSWPAVASLPASDPAADQLPPLPAANSHPNEPQYLARVSVTEACTDSAKQPSPEAELRDSLQSTAALLYGQADRHEADQEYDLADQLRSLARDLRDQASSISRRIQERQPEPVDNPVEPAATTVTVGPPPLG
jgi:hypothetical protein